MLCIKPKTDVSEVAVYWVQRIKCDVLFYYSKLAGFVSNVSWANLPLIYGWPRRRRLKSSGYNLDDADGPNNSQKAANGLFNMFKTSRSLN